MIGAGALRGVTIQLTHGDELDGAWKAISSEEVTGQLCFHLKVSMSSFIAVCS